MSVVVCKVTPKYIYMGADSRITYSECNAVSDPDLKLFVDDVHGIVGGTAGFAEHAVSFRVFMSTFLEEDRVRLTRDMNGVSEFFSKFTDFAEERNIKIVDKDSILGHFILTSPYGAWCAEGGYIKEITTYETIGCGETSARPIMHIGEAMHKALDAACEFNIHCAYPLVFYRTNRKTHSVRSKIIKYPSGVYLTDEELWK